MKQCKTCGKDLTKNQKSTCSHVCRNLYVGLLLKGRPSPFKGKQRWTEKQKKDISDSQKGKPKSEAFKEKCRQRMKGITLFKGHKQSEKQKSMMRARGGENHYNFKNKNSTGQNKSDYSVNLRREKNGFSKELFESLLAEQNGLCAICGIILETGLTSKAASADHDHIAKVARGILCKKCNLLLGHAGDNISILESAIKYLNFFKRTA